MAIDMVPLLDINSTLSATETFEFAEVGHVTFFIGTTNTQQGLWKTDGTQAGTVLVREFHVGMPTWRAVRAMNNPEGIPKCAGRAVRDQPR